MPEVGRYLQPEKCSEWHRPLPRPIGHPVSAQVRASESSSAATDWSVFLAASQKQCRAVFAGEVLSTRLQLRKHKRSLCKTLRTNLQSLAGKAEDMR